MDRLQASDIERSRSELADLERRFLERVAMTNRCKTGGEIGTGTFVRRYTRIVQHMVTPTVTIMICLLFPTILERCVCLVLSGWIRKWQ